MTIESGNIVTNDTDIDEDGVLTPSSTDEDDFYHEKRKKKRLDANDLTSDYTTLKF